MIVSQEWDGTNTSYVEGDKVLFKGVVCECINDIAANASNQTPIYTFNTRTGYTTGDATNWIVRGVVDDSLSFFALTEAAKLAIATDDDEILNSVPMAMKDVERSFYTRQRVPVMIQEYVMTVDAEGRVTPPSDLYEVIHQNIESDVNTDVVNNLISAGRIQIIQANAFESQFLKETTGDDLNFLGNGVQSFARTLTYFRYGRQWEYQPGLAEGTKIRLVYYAKIPQLNTIHPVVNASGLPINAEGQTLAQWLEAGESEDTFVQTTLYIDTNWFSSVKPDIYKFGAIMHLEQYLHDKDQWPVWQQKAVQSEAELSDWIDRFDDSGSNTSIFYTTYPI